MAASREGNWPGTPLIFPDSSHLSRCSSGSADWNELIVKDREQETVPQGPTQALLLACLNQPLSSAHLIYFQVRGTFQVVG